jgi:uncharacterized protein YacL
MKNINCSLCCFIAAALLGSMFYFILNGNNNNKILYFRSLLNANQQEIHTKIIKERMNIYVQGFILGLIIALVYLKTLTKNNQPIYCVFIAIVLGITYIHYTLMPKSTYMLDHINTPEQARAWLKIYQHMKLNCHIGMVLGVVALPFVCKIFS